MFIYITSPLRGQRGFNFLFVSAYDRHVHMICESAFLKRIKIVVFDYNFGSFLVSAPHRRRVGNPARHGCEAGVPADWIELRLVQGLVSAPNGCRVGKRARHGGEAGVPTSQALCFLQHKLSQHLFGHWSTVRFIYCHRKHNNFQQVLQNIFHVLVAAIKITLQHDYRGFTMLSLCPPREGLLTRYSPRASCSPEEVEGGGGRGRPE